jgi:cytochrome P450
MLDAVARLSSRVFLGDQLCRNEAWLKITKEYTIDMFRASQRLTLIPSGLKYLHTIFSQQGRTLCDQVRRAQELVNPVLEQRRIIKDQARSAGILIPKFNDAIDWAEAECKGVSYDPAGFQLFLSFAAIHTTSDLLSKIMLLLAREPALIDPLRQEMVHALQTNGWSKSSLFNMKLVDSTMKEAQRMMPSEKGES